jgi:hypothetical protein
VAVSVDFKLAWLGRIYRRSQTNHRTLLDEILVESDARVADVEKGRSISQYSGGGHSTSFSFPGSGAPAPHEIVALCSEMERRYNSAKTYLLTLTATTTESAVYAEMVAEMPIPLPAGPVSVRGDYTDLRTPDPVETTLA